MAIYPVLTFLHIAMGSVALVAGAGDMTFRKGSRWHRRAGSLFFVSMLILSALWRMGFALFIAAGSLFLGQPDVFPEALRSIAFRAVPAILVIGLTIFRLIRVSFTGWYGKQAANRDEPGIRQGIGWRGRGRTARAAGQSAPQSGHTLGPAAD
jgi:hypothetical protein